jgi:hypothetical protein
LDELVGYVRGDIGRTEASARIARNYRGLVDAYLAAAHGSIARQ